MKIVLTVLIVLAIISTSVSATITIDFNDNIGSYSPSQKLDGSLDLVFNEYIPQDTVIKSYIENQFISSITMSGHINTPQSYSFIDHEFDYNVTGEGVNTWVEYPTEDFSYTVKASGTCGGSYCEPGCTCPANCVPSGSYPCYWESEYSDLDQVNGGQGLLKIYDVSLSIEVPKDSNNDTLWEVLYNSNSKVELANHAACGNGNYEGYTVAQNGWVYRSINPIELSPGGDSSMEGTIETFNHNSLSDNQTQYNGGPGGIYRDGVYQSFTTQKLSGPEDYGVYWNGTSGYIKIFNYKATSVYSIVYLPSNGPELCAFTDTNQSGSENWEKSVTIKGVTTSYKDPYYKTYTNNDIMSILLPNDCPQGSQECEKTLTAYSAQEVWDKNDVVTVSWETSTVSGLTNSRDLSQDYVLSVPLNGFSNLKAPKTFGNFTVKFVFEYENEEIASAQFELSSLEDNDGDGYNPASGDCDDTDPNIYPGSVEICDGLDNDCDGDIDEDFWTAGSKLGSSCGIGLCAGVFVCTPDGGNVVCNNEYFEGEFPEFCGDGIDNDCDGVVDELYENDGSTGCFCKDGETKECGSSIGECVSGIQVCDNGVWGKCNNAKNPETEVCNQKDDDCDNVIDNIFNSGSVESTKCQCFNGKSPKKEVCNDIDDDCNSKIDDGISCCTGTEKRVCGTSVGECIEGVQYCDNDKWGACIGGTNPTQEICFDKKDNDCDGNIDEECEELAMACSNGVLDTGEDDVDCGGLCPNPCGIPFYMLIFASIVIAIVGAIAFLQLHPIRM